ncbi:MAG: fatty acid desaturase [Planctomycetaceae bacterium]|nr:fatty acid desaturase [Planctomycetaceae bacterium]
MIQQAQHVPVELLSRAQYAAVVKPLLPSEAFVPSKRPLWQIGLHLGVIALCIAGIAAVPYLAVRFLLSAVIGHSLMCLVFLAHELSHGGILRGSRLRYPLEVILWGMNVVPATMWRRIHNETHHVHANTLGDTDRYFRECELHEPGGTARRWYARWFMPHRLTSKWNLGVGFHFVTYIVRHLATVYLPGEHKLSIVTAKPHYRPGDKARILFELACIAAMQLVIYLAVGRSLTAYLFAGPVALLFTSTFAMSYIWTNHYLHGLHELHDPLVGSTSIVVPPLLDRLHSYFSYHTEHHLFPGMSARYYPLVSEILRQKFPERYHRITYREAWSQLWKGELHIVEPAVTKPLVDATEAGLSGPHGSFGETPAAPPAAASTPRENGAPAGGPAPSAVTS